MTTVLMVAYQRLNSLPQYDTRFVLHKVTPPEWGPTPVHIHRLDAPNRYTSLGAPRPTFPCTSIVVAHRNWAALWFLLPSPFQRPIRTSHDMEN